MKKPKRKRTPKPREWWLWIEPDCGEAVVCMPNQTAKKMGRDLNGAEIVRVREVKS